MDRAHKPNSTQKLLVTTREEYSLYVLQSHSAEDDIRKHLDAWQQLYDIPSENILYAIEHGYAIKPKSVKINKFKDIQIGMLLMYKGSSLQYRIESLNFLTEVVGVQTDELCNDTRKLFNFMNYGTFWWIVGDSHDPKNGHVTHRLANPRPPKLTPREITFSFGKQLQASSIAELEADLDYWLASLNHAIAEENKQDIVLCKENLLNIQRQLQALNNTLNS